MADQEDLCEAGIPANTGPALERLFSEPADVSVVSLISTVLVVDDDTALTASVINLLSCEEREFVHAASVAEALSQLQSRRFDLVLLDYLLPDGVGIDVMHWLRREKRGEAVIMLSGETSLDAVIGGLRGGAYDYLRKPYLPDELRRAVNNALRRAELARSNEAMRLQLEHANRLHRYVVESSPDLIYTLTPAGIISYVNKRAESLLGMDRRALIGQSYRVLLCEDDVERARHAVRERRSGARASANVEVRFARKATADNAEACAQPSFVTVALNAMGMYERHEGQLTDRFIGTYGVARDISERKRAEELIAFQAYHDQLTQLPNRSLFKDRLELAIVQARRRESQLAVMFIDVDRFKLVNDSFGHSEGDVLLRALATRLKRCLRQGDTLARQGGDEFTILLPDLAAIDDARLIASKIFDELRAPFRLAQQDFRATISLGIAIYPRDGATADQLIAHADMAMYQVKTHGKNNHSFFQPAMDMAHTQRIKLENELMRAIDGHQLFLEYQPKFSITRDHIVGAEALLRWRHPSRGLVSPAEFIAIAEETGHIHAISDWVLQQACAQLGHWQRNGHPRLQLSFNLSPRDFDRDDIADKISAVAAQHQILPGTLEVEITESCLLHNAEDVADKIGRLRQHGIRVAIDDFGIGYSSLAYLLKLPVSSLKIDRSFVRELSAGASHHPIVSAIGGVARGFGLHVVAEGVEHACQIAALQAIGCDEMQGYYFSKPLSAAALTAQLRGLQ